MVCVKLSFDKRMISCGKQRAGAISKFDSSPYVPVMTGGEKVMAKIVTVLTSVTLVCIALAPALYTYAALV